MSDSDDNTKIGFYEKLKGNKNFHSWSKSMELRLKSKNIWDVVENDKLIEKPSKANLDLTDPAVKEKYAKDKKKWQKTHDKKAKAAEAIYNAISKEHQPIVEEDFDSPHKMWNLLKANFEQTTAGRGLSADAIRERLTHETYTFGDDIDVFCSGFTKNAHALVKACGRNTDVNGELISKLMDAMPSSQPDVASLKVSVRRELRKQPTDTPTPTKWSDLLEEFRSEVLDALRKERREDAFVSRSPRTLNAGTPSNKRKGGKFCDHCNFPGHEIKDCFRKDPSKKAAYEKRKAEKERKEKQDEKDGKDTKKRTGSPTPKVKQELRRKRSKLPAVLGEDAAMAEIYEEGDEQVLNVADIPNKSLRQSFGDSACTKHMYANIAFFSTIRKLDQKIMVRVGNGEMVPAIATGDITLNLLLNKQVKPVTIKDVLYVPQLMANLLSIRQFAESGITTNFEGRRDKSDHPLKANFSKNGKTIMTATLKNNQYHIDVAEDQLEDVDITETQVNPSLIKEMFEILQLEMDQSDIEMIDYDSGESMDSESTSDDDNITQSTTSDFGMTVELLDLPIPTTEKVSATQFQTIWHHRLGHPNSEVMKLLSYSSDIRDKEYLRGCKLSKTSCISCAEGKMSKLPHTAALKERLESQPRVNKIMEMVHTDLSGKISPQSYPGGFRYFQLFIDDHSKFITIAFLKHKSEALKRMKEFKAVSEAQTGKVLKRIKSDGGGEFVNKEAARFYLKEGIIHETSPPYNPQLNGKAERSMRSISDKMVCLMFTAGAPSYLWKDAAAYAVQLHDVLPCSANKDNKSPFELLNGYSPSLKRFKVWGCTAMVHIPKESRAEKGKSAKLSKKAKRMAFVGISDIESGIYRFYDPKTRSYTDSADAHFDEANFDVISANSGVEPNGLSTSWATQGKTSSESIPKILRCGATPKRRITLIRSASENFH